MNATPVGSITLQIQMQSVVMKPLTVRRESAVVFSCILVNAQHIGTYLKFVHVNEIRILCHVHFLYNKPFLRKQMEFDLILL